MWELDNKKSLSTENWCLWTVVLEKTFERPLDGKEIKPGNPKGYQPLNIHWKDWCWSWSSNIWPLDVKIQLTGKDPDAAKDWRQEEKWATRDEMVGWHHQLNGYEFEQTLGNREGQRSLACCSPWGHTESDMTEWLNKPPIQEVPHRESFLQTLWQRADMLLAQDKPWYLINSRAESTNFRGRLRWVPETAALPLP